VDQVVELIVREAVLKTFRLEIIDEIFLLLRRLQLLGHL
jgi:hypothetical protein